MRIGIDLGGTKIEGIVLDYQGRERARKRVPTPSGNYQATVVAIRDLIDGLCTEAVVDEKTPVGIGIPGALSSATGLIKNANSTCLIGKALDKDLAEATGRDIRLANDADCFTMSEATDGAGQGFRTVFGVILGTGCGGGFVVEGNLLDGPNAVAGEWGHNPLPWASDAERPGPECYCGKHGCIETFVSGPGLSQAYEECTSVFKTATEISVLAESNDKAAAQALSLYDTRLARALASVINVLDPHVIVVGGGLSNIDRLYKTIPEIWGQWIFSDEAVTPFERNKHGDSSGVRGAAWLWDA
jgi:fructokinase